MPNLAEPTPIADFDDARSRLPSASGSVSAAGSPRKPRSTTRRWVTAPRTLGGRVLRVMRFAAAGAADERIAQVAASLTFTTVLSLVPMLAVIIALFTAFPLFAEFQHALDEFMVNSLMPAAVANTVVNYLNQFALQASRLSTLGAIFLAGTSITLIITIDRTFNDIWHVKRQRPLVQRVLVYWAVLSLGPVMLGASLWTTSYLARESLGLIGEISVPAGMALSFLPMVVTGLGISAMFILIPNQYVNWKDAVMGGFSTALVLELMKNVLAWYLANFPTYTVVYGAFAILPIFLLWLYLSWLVVLFGATVTASLPLIRLGRHDFNRSAGAPFIDALNVLRRLADRRGAVPPGLSTRALRARLHLNSDELMMVLEALADIGYIARIGEGSKERWALVCDPATASVGKVLDKLLLDRHQPQLESDPALRATLNEVWRYFARGETPTLAQILAPAAAPADKR